MTGDQLTQSHRYAAASIRPKCVELRHLCDDFVNENKRKYDILRKSLELHRQLDKVRRESCDHDVCKILCNVSYLSSLPHVVKMLR